LRTREGHIEIIKIGYVINYSVVLIGTPQLASNLSGHDLSGHVPLSRWDLILVASGAPDIWGTALRVHVWTAVLGRLSATSMVRVHCNFGARRQSGTTSAPSYDGER
jgi:hypothetical protein